MTTRKTVAKVALVAAPFVLGGLSLVSVLTSGDIPHRTDKELLYPRVAEIFGARESFNMLLRPDNHIAYVSPDTSPGGPRADPKDFIAAS